MLFWIFPTCREVFRMPKETLAVKKKKSGNIFRCDWHYAPWSTYAIIGIFTPTFSSGQFSRSVLSDSLWPMNRSMPGLPVHHQLLDFTQTHVHRVGDAIQLSHPLLSLLLPQSLPASESFPMSQLFASCGQNIGISALASFLPKNTEDWPPLEWTGWISLQSEGLSRVFSNITVQKHQFFGAQLSSQSALTSIHDYWKNHSLD